MIMFEKATTNSVKIADAHLDKTAKRIWKYAKNPKFYTTAVNRFQHYTNPVAYVVKGQYYILTHFGSLQSLKDLNQDEITLDVIDLKKEEVMEFLLSFQYHQHKEIMCMVELFKIATAHTAKGSAGEKWLNLIISGTKDKEKQFAELFGISIHATKCYLKLSKPEHRDTLAKFALDNEYTITEAYRECCKRETDNKPIIGGSVVENQIQALVFPTGTDKTVVVPASSGSNTNQTKTIKNAAPQIFIAPDAGNAQASGKSNPVAPTVASSVTNPQQPPMLHPLTSEIVVKFNSGQKLSLTGIIDFTVDGNPVINTSQLKANGNDWELPDGNAHFFLSIYNA